MMPSSVRKATQVLDLFTVERPDWGPTEVAAELGIAKSTAHALLAELARAGLTERLPSGRYGLGWRTVALARTMLATSRLRSAAAPLTRQLSAHFEGVTCAVAPVRPAGAIALCANSDRFAGRGDEYGRAVAGVARRVTRAVRE